MRLITWNINSLRLRLPLLAEVIEALRPDVICLQETKVPDDLFPKDAVAQLGFPHMAFKGMKGYNGVAILSKLPLSDIRAPERVGKDDCRHLIAQIGDVEIHNLYIPAGGDIPDPDANEKFAHKLDFLRELTDWYPSAYGPDRKMILVGDLNIAPLPSDVWSHKALLSVVSHTPIEVELLGKLQDSLNWVDGVRHLVSPDLQLYSWWSYRSNDWTKNDRGRRLDHIWVTPPLQSALRSTLIARECRSWNQPSDHVPVVMDFDI